MIPQRRSSAPEMARQRSDSAGTSPMAGVGYNGVSNREGRPLGGGRSGDRSGSPYMNPGSGAIPRTSSGHAQSSATYRSGRSSSADFRRNSQNSDGSFPARDRNYSPDSTSREHRRGGRHHTTGNALRIPSFDNADLSDGNLGRMRAPGGAISSPMSRGSGSPMAFSPGGPPGGSVGILGGSVGVPGAPGMPLSNNPQGTLGVPRDMYRGGPPGSSSAAKRSHSASGAELQSVMRPMSIPEGEGLGGSIAMMEEDLRKQGRQRSVTEGNAMLPGPLAGRTRSTSPDLSNVLGPVAKRDRSQSAEEYVPRRPSGFEAQSQSMSGGVPYTAFDRVRQNGRGPDAIALNVQNGQVPPVAVTEPDTRDTHPMKLSAMFGAWVYCVVSWFCGVSLPCSVLDVMPHTALHWSMTRSLVHTLSDLVNKKCWFPLFALGFFSLAVPLGKMSGTCFLIYKLMRNRASDVRRENELMIHILSYLASYQFVDLYTGVLFVCYFNSDASVATFEVGFYWFFSYCVMSLVLSVVLENTLLEASVSLKDETPKSTLRLHVSSEAAGETKPADETTDLQRQSFPDLMTIRFFSACFLVMFISCMWAGFLEVRMLVHDVAVERTVFSLKEVLVDFLPLRVNIVVLLALWLFCVFFPLAYTAAQMVRVEHRLRYQGDDGVLLDERIFFTGIKASTLFQTWPKLAVDMLRQWAHVDVFAVACLIFLFMIQDDYTLTMVPDGSVAFFIFLAASFSFFFLRWFAEREITSQPLCSSNVRFGVLVSIFVGLTIILWGGVPGASPHFQYRSLDSVCAHASPFFHKVSSELPAAYGNCDDLESDPPQPCYGSSNLKTSGNDKEYMNAIWMGGLRSMRINSCSISKVPASEGHPGTSSYHFHIGGAFDHIAMFLRVKQCMPVGGCVKMNSAKHCCGNDISFNFTFALNCQESTGSYNAIRSLKLTDAALGAMLIQQDMLDGMVKVQAMDISGQVESSVKGHIEKVLQTKIQWGGRELDMVSMLNKIVQYNAPSDAGKCL